MKNRLIEEEIKKKGFKESDGETSRAFFNQAKKKEQNTYFKLECYNCGKKGHRKSECRYKNPRFKKRSNFQKKEANAAEPESEEVCFLENGGETPEEKNESIYFYLDSGASDHLINTEKYFHQFIVLENPIKINIAKKEQSLMAVKIGTILLEDCKLTNVLYVPNLRSNLLSINRIEQSGFGIKFENNKVQIHRNGKIIKEGYKKNNLYEMKFTIKEASAQKAYESYKIWHNRLGHASVEKMKELKKRGLINCETEGQEILCEPCIKGRQTRLPFNNKHQETKRLLELIHSDLCGPINPATHNNKKYMLTFLDDYSHFVVVYLLEKKSETALRNV